MLISGLVFLQATKIEIANPTCSLHCSDFKNVDLKYIVYMGSCATLPLNLSGAWSDSVAQGLGGGELFPQDLYFDTIRSYVYLSRHIPG